MSTAPRRLLATVPISRRESELLGALVATEILLLGWYFALTPAGIRLARYVLYPFVWINVGVWGIMRTETPTAGSRARWAGTAIAAGYFLALALVSGLVSVTLPEFPSLAAVTAASIVPVGALVDLVGLPVAHAGADSHGLQVSMAAPGWGPRIAYVGESFYVYFIPYRVAGYLSLAYLVYATVLDAAAATVTGALGVLSCLSCTFPFASTAVAGATGSAALAAAATSLSIDISTAVFVATAVLLTWRPGFGE
jgi:hypothetical protein